MPVVRVKGVQNAMQFPDDMEINDIRSFLQRRFANQAVAGNQPMDLAPLQGQARASEQSLAQKAGQGISNALVDSGIISDRFGAQQIGKNVTSIGEFLPGIGDATAGDEFGRALKQGDNFGMAMGALGAIPLVGDAAKKVKRLITNDGDEYFELSSGEIVSDLNSNDVIFDNAKEAEGYLDGLYQEGSSKYNAVQQGYTGEIKGTKASKNKLYHGTSDDIESFDKSKLQARDDGAIGTGVYVTSSPKIAESYANLSSPRFKSDKTGDYVEPNIIPISTRAKNTKVFTLPEKLDFMSEINKNRNFSKELTAKLKAEGYDSSAVIDVNGQMIEMNIFDPKMVRASHAKFDPKNKEKAGLLGGLGAVAVSGMLAKDDEQSELN
jgi:hypothetical protein